MALQARAACVHGLHVVPIGLTFEDKARPDTVVVARVGEALEHGPAALRVAGKWQLPERIHTSMERSQAGNTPDSLGRSLRYGQLVGALALLCKHGRMEDLNALALIERVETRPHATADIWKRVRRSVDSAG